VIESRVHKSREKGNLPLVVGRGSGETEVFKEHEATRKRRGADIYIYIFFSCLGKCYMGFFAVLLGLLWDEGFCFFFFFFPDWGCYGVGGAVCRLPGGKHVEQ